MMPSRARKFFILTGILVSLIACNRPSSGGEKAGEAVITGGQAWEFVNPHSSEWPLGPVTAGNPGFVSASPSGVQFSTDGKFWRDARMPVPLTEGGVRAIIYGANRYVMVLGKEILASDDGSSWEIQVNGTKYFNAAAYGNGVFVVGGYRGALMTSKDAKTWIEISADTAMDFTSIAFGNGVFVAVNSEKNEIWNSPDAVSWSKAQDIEIPVLEGYEPDEDDSQDEGYGKTGPSYVIFGNGRFLVVGRQFYQSKDGRTWQADGYGLEEKVYFANDRFLSFDQGGYAHVVGVSTSKDLVDWDRQETDLEFKPGWVAFLHGRYVTGNDGPFALCAKQLTRWSPGNMVTVRNLHGVAFGDDRFVAVGDSGTVVSSPDGFGWTVEKSPTTVNLTVVAYGNGAFVAGGYRSKPLFSRNGTSWKYAESASEAGLASLVFGNGLFVAVDFRDATSVLVSEQGKIWRRVEVGDIMRPKVIFGNGVFLLVGEDKVFRSTDGKQWRRIWLGGSTWSDIEFDGRRFVFPARAPSGAVYSNIVSVDGENWIDTPWHPQTRRKHVPPGKGEAILAMSRILWQTSDSLFEIFQPGRSVNAIEYGKGVFVGVGYKGAIAALKIPYQPEAKMGAAQAAAPEKIGPFESRFFLGELDRKYLVYMRLTHAGENLNGEYRYLRQKTPLQLQGRMDADGEFTLQESMDEGKSTGNMAGRLSRGLIHGEWSNPEGTKRLNLTAMETTEKLMSEMTKRFASLNAKWVGTYVVTSLGDMVGANTLYDCSREDTGWACSGSSIVGGQRKAFPDGFDPVFDLKLVSTMRVEIKSDLTVELFVKGKSRWVLPVNENRFAYFREPKSIANGMKIKELVGEDGRENGVFNLIENDGSLILDGHPQLYLKKVR